MTAKSATKTNAQKKGAAKSAAKKNKTSQQENQISKEKLENIRTAFLVKFGQVTLSLMGVPRYGHQSISDLQRLILEPLIRDRIAVATAKGDEERGAHQGALAGIAIWASVSEEVDAKIREQVKAGVFPIRLSGNEWTSGDKVWLLDVIAPSQKLATSVLANFNQVVDGGKISLHPVISKMIDPEDLKKMGATSDDKAREEGTDSDGPDTAKVVAANRKAAANGASPA